MTAVVPFDAHRHGDGVAALCRAEGWGIYADPAVVAGPSRRRG